MRFYETTTLDLSRCRWLVRGRVQGVGFRPFVYRQARQLNLQGAVSNNTEGVIIEAQGPADVLDQFEKQLIDQCPPLATIQSMTRQPIPTAQYDAAFRIQPSDPQGAVHAEVTPDAALCGDCLAQMLDPDDRRHRHALINCTNCGPRYSIIKSVPYDRPNTTMASFTMCPACAKEYRRPEDRRFHAQPIACRECGPKLELADARGDLIYEEPIAGAAKRLLAGQILAIKGLGGFHLAVRADDHKAVSRLRRLKKRDAKPFALMVRSIDHAQRLVQLSAAAQLLIQSPARPIVLADRRPNTEIASSVAPGNHRLGVMLPYTPIHHLLFDDSRLPALVMTSGNLCDEPLVIDNQEAIQRLGSLCDSVLWHDRPIERCVDDSVYLDFPDGAPLPIRRSRGHAPATTPLPSAIHGEHGDGLCIGGELKNTVAVVRARSVVMSQHLGDLTNPLAFDYFKKAITDLCDLFGAAPRWIAHDMHPLYLSTAHAKQLSQTLGVPTIAVQHHHAHAASLLAEHDCAGPVLAVICDGVGYGGDGQIWGGELLLADLLDFTHLAQLTPLQLPGGDAAAKDTRRCALALLHQAYGPDFDQHPATKSLIPDDPQRRMLTTMIQRHIQCAPSSAAGRYFDAAASLLGLCAHNQFEAQAPMVLEAAADAIPAPPTDDAPRLYQLDDHDPMRINLAPLTRTLVERKERGESINELAALFHDQFASAWSEAVTVWADRVNVQTVALSGGVFCNQRLTLALTTALRHRGLRVLRHRMAPPNDGGIALGQAAVAAARVGAGWIKPAVKHETIPVAANYHARS